MAELYKENSSKNWWCRISNPFGGRAIRKSTGYSDKRSAEIRAAQIEREILSQDRPIYLFEALNAAAEEQELNRRAGVTTDRGRISGAHWLNTFGPKFDLANCKPIATGERYMRNRRDMGIMDATISKEVGFLIMGLHRLKREERYRGEPKLFRPRGLKKSDQRRLVIEVDQLPGFLAAHDADVQRLGLPDRTDRILGYFYLGLRNSEPLKVPKKEVRLSQRLLWVEGTKTAESKRDVPIPAALRPIVERLLDETPGDNLFPNDWAPSSMAKQLRRWGLAADLGPICPNDLRRSYATFCADAGVREGTCESYMGHKNSTMIREVYAQLTDRQHEEALDQMDSLSGPPLRLISGRTPRQSTETQGF